MTDTNEGMPWQTRTDTSSTQRDILEQILLHYPKRLARWIATHCPERLLPNKESAGVLDALEGWNDDQNDRWTTNVWTVSLPTRPVYPKTIPHGNNNNGSSK